jgi:hypothetical protein
VVYRLKNGNVVMLISWFGNSVILREYIFKQKCTLERDIMSTTY